MVTAGDATVVVDSVSYDFVKGAKLDYSEELIRASFQASGGDSAVHNAPNVSSEANPREAREEPGAHLCRALCR